MIIIKKKIDNSTSSWLFVSLISSAHTLILAQNILDAPTFGSRVPVMVRVRWLIPDQSQSGGVLNGDFTRDFRRRRGRCVEDPFNSELALFVIRINGFLISYRVSGVWHRSHVRSFGFTLLCLVMIKVKKQLRVNY